MHTTFHRRIAPVLFVLCTLAAPAVQAHAGDSAAGLLERLQRLSPQIEQSPFQRPLVVDSREQDGNRLLGQVDAVMAQPYALVREQLQRPDALCEILMLQINTKHCRVDGPTLTVRLGSKTDQPLEDAHRVVFTLQPEVDSTALMSFRLGADSGPFSTRDFRIQVQAVPLDNGQRTYLHLGFSYGMSLPAKLAMQSYFATIGGSKIGFSRGANGPVGGLRGAIERNTMRYYLAIETYLASLSTPPAERRAWRLDRWYSATEQYARQLHELNRADYLALKQRDFSRGAGA